MKEYMTEEVYYFDSLKEAEDAMEKMRCERACDLGFRFDNHDPNHVKMIVEVGEPR